MSADHFRCTSFVDPKQECERHAGLKRILPPVVSAKFRSKKTFNFKYGKVEIRAKLPKGDWIFPGMENYIFLLFYKSDWQFFLQKYIWNQPKIGIEDLKTWHI